MHIKVKASYFPIITKWHLQRVLEWFSVEDLSGLESIQLIDECPDDLESCRVARHLWGFLYNGHYSRRTRHQPAEIVLYLRDVYFGIPKLLMVTPVARLRLAAKLAHEVGHHVIATRGHIHDTSERYRPWVSKQNPHEEERAEAYASEVVGRMLHRWPYRLGRWLARRVSSLLFHAGIQDYADGNYLSAASLESRAYTLNPDNKSAGQCYRHAMEKLKTQTPSPLSAIEKHWLTHHYKSKAS